jgi:hypothetical protein
VKNISEEGSKLLPFPYLDCGTEDLLMNFEIYSVAIFSG